MASPPTLISLEDYETIADAVMETERGRWFLAEFARRNRSADTASVLEALAALERRLPLSDVPPAALLAAPPGARDSANVETLLPLIEAAVDRAARIQAELSTAPNRNEPIDRALRDCVELDNALGQALAALGQPRPAPCHVERKASASGTRADRVSSLGPEEDLGWIDIEDFEAEIAGAIDDAPTRADVTPPHAGFASTSFIDDGFDEHEPFGDQSDETAVLVTGGPALRDADETPPATPRIMPDDARLHAADRVPELDYGPVKDAAIPRQPARPRLPAAWTPGLLDALTPEERAILFA